MNNKGEISELSTRVHVRLRWAVTLAWAGLIFYLSTGAFGGSFTEALLRLILGLLRVTVSPATFDLLHLLMRKSAHLTEYGIFALLIYVSLLNEKELAWRPRKALIAVLIAGGYSLTDEFHQRFVPGREPSLKDCGIDTIGAIFAMTLAYLRCRLVPGRTILGSPGQETASEI